MSASDRAQELVLVIGATRGTGTEIVSRLRRDGYAVRALARNPSSAARTLGDQVEIVQGDVTKPDALPNVVRGASHIIFTAGVTKRPASERSIIAVEYDGVRNTLAAATAVGFGGRFLYMTTIGVTRYSIESIGLNLIKGRTMTWRRRAEEAIRASGIDYTIVRCGVLSNSAEHHAVELSQKAHRMSLFRRISRDAVAEIFVQALRHPSSRRATLEASWSSGPAESWDTLFSRIHPDVPAEARPIAS
jgi:uncharacterized protein YbjT (DUF2867 family)